MSYPVVLSKLDHTSIIGTREFDQTNTNLVALREEMGEIRGKITKITPASEEGRKGGQLGFLMVEGMGLDGKAVKASVAVFRATRFVKQKGDERGEAVFEDLKEGMSVEIKVKGSVLMSYPIKATAEEICIVE